HGVELKRLEATLTQLRPHLTDLLEELNRQRQEFVELHQEDMDELVERTTYVSIIGLGSAILIGVLLSMAFARRILKRIQILSESAERVTRGDFSPPPAPDKIHDELDGLAVSINHMTDQLIGVVASEKLIEGAEEERRRIAMDLHDQTLADLASVQRGLEQLPGEDAARIEADLQRAISNLRVVMDDLHPQTLDILGLGAAIESHLEKTCSRSGAPEYFWLAGDEVVSLPLSRSIQVSLYRIAVEAIQNVMRHSGATRFEVAFARRGWELLLSVEDNGCGFNYASTISKGYGGRGLHNITERARTIGARVAWRPSRFSSGTRFELILPLEDE
ncbi:MAG: HAMP domain-containing protein, partial [Desulfuromonadales bacterium]|nr:HAMP domain-containing protein [Desulfuromonadales bacterium]